MELVLCDGEIAQEEQEEGLYLRNKDGGLYREMEKEQT